jgi:hypothetical protein
MEIKREMVTTYRIEHHYNWEGVPMFQPQCKYTVHGHREWKNIGPAAFVENGGYRTEAEARLCIERLISTGGGVISHIYVAPNADVAVFEY